MQGNLKSLGWVVFTCSWDDPTSSNTLMWGTLRERIFEDSKNVAEQTKCEKNPLGL